MAGILSRFMDPGTQGLLNLSAGLLEASGPSLMPVGLGQAMSRGVRQGSQAYQQAAEAQGINAMRQAQMGMLQQQMRKAKFDADLTEQAMSGGIDGSSDPDRLEMLGTRLAMGGHVGGASLIAQAEKLRAAQQNRQAVLGLQSAPGVLGAGVTTTSPQGQALLGNLTGDQAFDADILRAQNEALNSNQNLAPQPIQAPRMGLFDTLKTSPYVGSFAEQLQTQLDAPSATGLKAQDWLGQYDRLQQQHVTSTNAATARGEQADLRRELADQASLDRRMIAASNAGRSRDRREDLDAQRTFTRERSLANDFNKLSEDYRTVLPVFQSTAQYIAGQKYDSSGDRALAFSFARTLDPKDRVGVRDIADINRLGNLPERFTQAISALAQGKELPARVRLEMFQVMRRQFDNMNELQQQYEDEYERKAKSYMIRPENVVTRLSTRKKSSGWSATEVKGGK